MISSFAISNGKYLLNMIVGSDCEFDKGCEKESSEVIINSKELMEIDNIVVLFDDFVDIVMFD